MEMGWVSGSGCILKDHLVVYQNALHKSCKNMYFKQQDVRLFTEEWKRDWERERCVRGRERETETETERMRGKEREEREIVYIYPLLFLPHPHPTQTPGCGIASLCTCLPGQQWSHLGLGFLLRSPQSGWEDLHKSYPLLFSPPS